MSLVAPPFPNEDAFFCRFFTEVGSYLDAAKRYLHEVDFRAEEEITAFSNCPFNDSRYGYYMNKAALIQITGEWEQIITGIKHFTSFFEVTTTEQLNLTRAWRISLSTMFSPLYFFHRKKNSFKNGCLPTKISGIFKIMLDVPTTIDLMVMEGLSENFNKTKDTAEKKIREFADKNLILLNGEYVCAGSPKLIDSVIKILFENNSIDNILHSDFHTYIDNKNEFLLFNYYMTSQYIISVIYLLSTMVSMETAFKQLIEQGKYIFQQSSPSLKLSAYEKRRRIAFSTVNSIQKQEETFKWLGNLIKEDNSWGIEIKYNTKISEVIEISLNFLKNSVFLDANKISGSHMTYQDKIKDYLFFHQEMAASAIGATDMFPKEINFSTNKQDPARILRELI